MTKTLTFRLLGELTIRRANGLVTGFHSRKEQALLCYLVVTGKPHRRPFLAGLFWGDWPERRALGNLRRALTHLRAVAGDHLLIARQTVEFNRESDYWLDVEEFEERAGWAIGQLVNWSEDLVTLQRAVELYRGDFLAGFYVRGAPAFEEWVMTERERLRGLAVNALRALLDLYQSRGDYPTAIAHARRLLALEPWLEETHRVLMHLLALDDQRELALAQYKTCRRLLAEELGVEPLEETTALYERIRSASSERLHNLPPQATPFVGRQEELAALAQRLTDATCRLVTVAGPGGVGKTRLAIQAATQVSAFFMHGVYFVPLAAANSTDSFISAIAQILGLTFVPRQAPRTQLYDFLREKEVLLVLDSFEHLISLPSSPPPAGGKEKGGSAGLLVDLLQRAPGVKILVTSREHLNLRWEWLFEIEGLRVPAGETDEEIKDCSAVQLFLGAARRAHWSFSLSGEKSAVVRICQLVAGMPLGIELAAAWVGAHPCEEIAQAIERNLGFLTTTLRDVPARHRSVRAAFDHSWHLLSAEEQRVFQSLSVFGGEFQEEAGVQVTGASPHTLAALEKKSLLHRHASGRYELHELLRQYAAEQLQAAETETHLREQHLNYFVALAERVGPKLEGPEQEVWLGQLEADHDNLRIALEWSLENKETASGLRLAGAVWRFWEVRGYLTSGRKWLEQLSARARHDETLVSARAKALNGAGRLAQCQGEFEQAAALLEESVALFRQLGDKQRIVDTLNNLGLVAWHQGDYDRAIAVHEENLALRRQLGDRQGVASSLGNLALVNWHQGNLEQARALYDEGLVIFRDLDDKKNVAISLRNMGSIAWDQENYPEAAALFEQSLELFQELGSKRDSAYSMGNLGYVARRQKNYERARTLWKQCLDLFRELGDKHGLAVALANLGKLASEQGDIARAEKRYRESLVLHREVKQKRDIAECLEGLAKMANRQDQAGRAARLLGAAEALREAVGAPVPPADRADYQNTLSTVRASLDEQSFEQAQGQGRAMSLDQALTYALGESLPSTAKA